MYLFVRQDLPVVHQIIQTNHATQQITALYRSDGGIPNLVLVGVADLEALHKVQKKLQESRIPHYAYNEPDDEMGFTAICTAAISGEQRTTLRHFKLYREGTSQEVCRSNPNFPTSTPVAQQQERLSL